MKRVLAIFLALVMLLSFAACSKGSGGGSTNSAKYTTGYDEEKYNPPGTFPVFKETQTISVMVPDSQYVEDWDTNYQTLLIEEKLNADLIMNVLPSKEYMTKINLMAASGGDELSDAVLGSFTDERVMSLAAADVIAPLTDYYYNTDIAYNLNEAIDRLGWNFFPQVTMPDGEIYCLPSINEEISNMNPQKFWIYKPWFDKLGINVDDIHTIDDLSAALKTIVTSDPNGNGKADEIGISSSTSSLKTWFNYLMNAFIYAGDSNRFIVEDGKLSFAFTRDEWKEGLKYIKGMYDEGLIDPQAFSQDSPTFTAILNYPETILTAFANTGPGGVRGDDPRRVEYYGLQPLNSSYNDGKPLASYTPPAAKPKFVVSSKAADIENTFRFGDYMTCTEVSVNQRYGKEGVDWYWSDPDKDVAMFADLGYAPGIKTVLVWSTLQNSHWYQTGPYIRELKWQGGLVPSDDPLDHNKVTAEAQLRYEGKNPKEYVTKLIYTEEEQDIVIEPLSALGKYVDEMSSKFITGAEDIDAGWDAFQAQILTIGAEDILECAQAAYDRMNAAMAD